MRDLTRTAASLTLVGVLQGTASSTGGGASCPPRSGGRRERRSRAISRRTRWPSDRRTRASETRGQASVAAPSSAAASSARARCEGGSSAEAPESSSFARSTAPLIAQMEADDERPNATAFKTMIAALRRERWDGVCSDAEPVGDCSERMRSYVRWQNSLVTPSDMAAARFVEIPALHQTALFTRRAVDAVLEGTRGAYRDGPDVAGADDEASSPTRRAAQALDTPVDLWWWLEFFRLGLTCGRVLAPRRGAEDDIAFFRWRQHPRNKTRVHGRLSVENLRRIKIHALLERYPTHKHVLLTSVGKTIDSWKRDLEAHPSSPERVDVVEWRPSKRTPPPVTPPALLRKDRPADLLRVWAYGDANARKRVRLHVPDWDDALDVFVA